MRVEAHGIELSINAITKITTTIQIKGIDVIIVINKENNRIRIAKIVTGEVNLDPEVLYDSKPNKE